MQIHAHTYTNIYIHKHIGTYAHTETLQTYTDTLHIHTKAHTNIYIHYIHTHTSADTNIYIYVHKYINRHIYIPKHKLYT